MDKPDSDKSLSHDNNLSIPLLPMTTSISYSPKHKSKEELGLLPITASEQTIDEDKDIEAIYPSMYTTTPASSAFRKVSGFQFGRKISRDHPIAMKEIHHDSAPRKTIRFQDEAVKASDGSEGKNSEDYT